MLEEFKKFIMRGNVLDLAVGVIIGAAFGRIVTSFVNDILMPPIGLALGGMDFSEFILELKAAEGDIPAVTINYGIFIQTLISFLITAFAIFIVIKSFNAFKRKKEEQPAAPAAPPADILLLTEIRDLLKK